MRKVLVLLGVIGVATAWSGAGTAVASVSRLTAAAVVPAAPSAGCDVAPPATPGETKQNVTVRGKERWWFRHVPTAYAGTTPVPLVMDLHGYSEGAAIHEQMSGLGKFGDAHGFATVTPQGQGPVAGWDTKLGSTDLAFLGKVLDTTEQQLCIDTNRVFAAGLSNGAFMTSAMACQYSTRIAAVAPVAGVRNIKGCAPKRPVPIVAFHGTADGYVSYTGGLGQKALDLPAPDGSGKTLRETLTPDALKAPKGAKGSIPNIMRAWAKRNGCGSGDTAKKVTSDVTKLTWHCTPADATILYRVTGGGHAWPGSAVSAGIVGIVGPTTMSIDADEIMWKFFQAHPLPAAK